MTGETCPKCGKGNLNVSKTYSGGRWDCMTFERAHSGEHLDVRRYCLGCHWTDLTTEKVLS